jgi:hypothetical protein
MHVLRWLMIAACVFFGLNTEITVGGAREAAAALTRGWP